MKRILLALCLLLAGLQGLALAAPPPLQFITHELPPLNFSDNGKPAGFCVDLVRELSLRAGVRAPVSIMPFARAYVVATSTPNVALFFTSRSSEREALFSWVGPIANVRSDFYVRADSAIVVNKLDDLRAVKAIITHRGSHNEEALKRLGFKNVVAVNRPEEAVRMLAENLYGDAALLITSAVVPQSLKKYGQPPNAIKPVYLARKLQGFIAFSKGTPADVVARFQAALDGMKRDGSFDALQQKWLIADAAVGNKPEQDIDNLAR